MDTVREEAWPVAAPQQRQQPPVPRPQHQQQQNGRIDLKELKAQLEKRVGPDRSRRYFGYLNGYLSEKLSRQDFEKLCLQTLGQENLQLHNRLIRSVLYNAYQAKCPPPPSDVGRPVGASVKKVSKAAEVLNACNGDARLLQVQGSRPIGTVQDHTLKNRMNNIGPNCRVTAAVNHNQVAHGVSGSLENGTLSPLELKRSVQFQQCEPAEPLAKHPRVEQLSPNNLLLQRRSMSSTAEQSAEILKSPVRAPLGIPFCSASVGGARKFPPPPIGASSGPSEATNEIRSNHLISINDFKVAMQLNPQQLGEDWPVLLEKICLCSSEEND
ncbi:uncharacterized protein C2845_PM15G24010 [Panicum miliaceum]|uniref:Uncharacterized protein n=1 Tax=Panicum miliaceum TaxID=4540 RepID=A0A3L6QAW9_PANMI|nr:uncharacterized protein C2845_PM15G24010 [Panicum miliaceum]